MKAKKAKKKIGTESIRKQWGFNPRTRVKPNDKKYKRNKAKEIPQE